MEQDPIAQSLQLANALGLDLSPGALIAGFVFSVVGFYLYREGRKRQKTKPMWIGIVMMIYPLFISGALNIWFAGLGLSAAAYFFWTTDESN